MKAILTAIAAIAFAGLAQASVETEIVRCVQKDMRPGAPTYVLSSVASAVPSQPTTYTLSKVPVNPRAEKVSTAMPAPIYYGNTLIASKNAGRSGYALLYVNGDKSVIDINLFQMRSSGFNTKGALTDYNCRFSK